jgi:hypothetical protein
MAFTQPESIAKTLTLIKDEAGRLAVSPPRARKTLMIAKKNNSLRDLWDQKIVHQSTSSLSENAEVKAEINQYLGLPLSSREATDPMMWWEQTGKMMFPTLKDIAVKHLAIPATSVPNERLFSAAGNIILSR